ncbi:hypothetical protein ACHWQZ_G010822 [Mnemiopsis leidyi]
MGILVRGDPLNWEDTKALSAYIKEHGVNQFINLMRTMKQRKYEGLKWGDEIEYLLFKFDHQKKRVYLHCKTQEYLERLAKHNCNFEMPVTFVEEYGSFQIESTPNKPFLDDFEELNNVIRDMRHRRKELMLLMDKDTETVLTLTNFPRLGCPDFCWPPAKPSPDGNVSQSIFFPDECINPHPRFPNLTRNIRQRRGKKVEINVPIYKDKNTPDPFVEFPDIPAAKPDHVYMDAMGFGMGCCCIQMTFQACNLDEAKVLYDQLAVVTPIVMALSAAAPIYRGYLCEVDCRWDVISAAVDDRTDEEIANPGESGARSSRYSTINSFLRSERFSDVNPPYDKAVFKKLLEANVENIDTLMARHIAHLFIRDPISAFSNRIELDDETDTDHFESLQSTNWQNMRFKPPPPGSDIGWRVEFRTIEAQITDFENAAFVSFCILLSRAMASFKCNFYIPLSLVQINMERAQRRDAVLKEKFYFRKNIQCCTCECDPDIVEMTIDEIINGNGEFPGICKVIRAYINNMDLEFVTATRICSYISLMQKRASGELLTTAAWLRQFVLTHPLYKQDSVVSEEMTYDLLMECNEITNGKACPELIGTLRQSSDHNNRHFRRDSYQTSDNPTSPVFDAESHVW